MEIRKGYKKIIENIQVISFQCALGNGSMSDKQYQYLLKGLVQDSIVLLLIEDAIKSYEESKDLHLALSKVGISIKDGVTHSKELGGKLFNIETEINLGADVIEDYVPENLLKHDKKIKSLNSHEEFVNLEKSLAKNIESDFLQKICILVMRSIAEQVSISKGEVIAIDNICNEWKMQHSEVISWYAELYDLISYCFSGIGMLNVTPFMPKFFDISDNQIIKTVFYNLNNSEEKKINNLCAETISKNMKFEDSIMHIQNYANITNKNFYAGNHPKDLNGSRFIFE
mgnify:FL=1|tara:strand:+ start:241 stop:1095 length:855 start_codon:yes stop_codon:yes gene_type:complete